MALKPWLLPLSAMRAPSLFSLVYLDLLEMYGNSRLVGQLCYLAQSNVYRSAMSLAEELGFDLQKLDGAYRCNRNRDVLTSLREASQLLRARGGPPLRLLADYRSPLLCRSLPESLWSLPQTWLGLRHSLQQLDEVVLDLLLVRSGELWPQLGVTPGPLSVGQWLYTPRLSVLPLNTETVQLYARPDHPLHRLTAITPAQLAAYPSPAVSEALFPGMRERLQPHGLWTTRIRRSGMQAGFWEQLALEHGMVVPSTPNAVMAVTRDTPDALRPLSYATGLTDHDVLVVPLPLLEEPMVQKAITTITAAYNLTLPGVRRVSGVSHRLLRSRGPVPIPMQQQSHLVADLG